MTELPTGDERITLCSLVPSAPDERDWIFLPDAHDEMGSGLGDFYLDRDASLRVQVGGTCVGNAVAKAIEILQKRLGAPCDDTLSGTGLWSEGQLYGGLHAVNPASGTQPRFVLQAAREWGWPLRSETPESPLVSLDAAALGELTTRARAEGSFALEYDLIQGEFFGLGDPCDNLEAALRSGHMVVTGGQVDDAFAQAAPGDRIFAPTASLGGHALAIDSVRRVGSVRLWGVLDTWGRGLDEAILERRRLWADDGWVRSRWELRALRMRRRA